MREKFKDGKKCWRWGGGKEKKRCGMEAWRHISGCGGGLRRLSGFDLAYTLCVSVCKCVFVCVWPVSEELIARGQGCRIREQLSSSGTKS